MINPCLILFITFNAGNRALFGKSGAVAPLVSYLQSSDLNVHITTTLALFQLSKDPWNCVTMHQHGVVTHLLRLIGKRFIIGIFHLEITDLIKKLYLVLISKQII